MLERLWQAAHCFHAEGSVAAQEFVTERLRRILLGEVGYVIAGLKQMGTKHKLRGARNGNCCLLSDTWNGIAT